MSRPYSVAISTCPNDTFIFEHVLCGRTTGFRSDDFRVAFYDIDQLNQSVLTAAFDIIKVSCSVFADVSDEYQFLPVGAALGTGVGPLLVGTRVLSCEQASCVFTPGEHTTANQLYGLFFPELPRKHVLFSEIPARLRENPDAVGLLIHEGRFTYTQEGLVKLADVGELWEEKFHLPLPLGGIVVRKSLPENVKKRFALSLRESMIFAQRRLPFLSEYVVEKAQEIDPRVIVQHIRLYVNDYTYALDDRGIAAIKTLLEAQHKTLPPDWLVSV